MPDYPTDALASGFIPLSPTRGFPSPQPWQPAIGYLHLDFHPLMVVAGSDELEHRELKDESTSLSGQVKQVSWGTTLRVWRCQGFFLSRDAVSAFREVARGQGSDGVVLAGGEMIGDDRVPVVVSVGTERRGQDAKTYTLDLTLTEKLYGEYGEPDEEVDEVLEDNLTG